MHNGQLCPTHKSVSSHEPRPPVRNSVKTYAFSILIVSFVLLYYASYMRVMDIQGNISATYFHLMFNRTLNNPKFHETERLSKNSTAFQQRYTNSIREISTEATPNEYGSNEEIPGEISKEVTPNEYGSNEEIPGEISKEDTPNDYGSNEEIIGEISTEATPNEYGSNEEIIGEVSTEVTPSEYGSNEEIPGEISTEATPNEYGSNEEIIGEISTEATPNEYGSNEEIIGEISTEVTPNEYGSNEETFFEISTEATPNEYGSHEEIPGEISTEATPNEYGSNEEIPSDEEETNDNFNETEADDNTIMKNEATEDEGNEELPINNETSTEYTAFEEIDNYGQSTTPDNSNEETKNEGYVVDNKSTEDKTSEQATTDNATEDSTDDEYDDTTVDHETTEDLTTDISAEDTSSKDNDVESTPTTTPETTTPQTILRMQGEIACKLPLLNPFDESIKSILHEDSNILPKDCSKFPQIFRSTLDSTIIRMENTSDWINCCYDSITRPSEISNGMDDDVEVIGDCIPIPDEVTQIPGDQEFVVIHCTIPESQKIALNTTDDEITVDAFPFTPYKPTRVTFTSKLTPTTPTDQVNIVVFGLDGVSHMNFKRIMPKVHEFLTQDLSAVEMNGYDKIGDNTFPNVLAVLTGMTVEEALDSCQENEFFDECPFVWKNYSAAGYRTSYGEDTPSISAFNYLKRGFIRTPVDYYLRPLSILADTDLGTDKRGIANICYGPRLAIEFLTDYVKKLAFAMNSESARYFQFMWSTSLTHDDLYLGLLGESTLLEMLQWFQSENYLNNTILVLMSDHGIRYGTFRNTRQGKIEENMPFVYFTFPQWFKNKYSRALENIMDNTNRLTTPFDLHETFLDLADLNSIENSEIRRREDVLKSQLAEDKVPRGISMFLPSPLERTCAMASIPEHFCACHETEVLPEGHSLAIQAANFAIYEMNSFISQHPMCSYLSLTNITKAYKFNSEDSKNTNLAEEGVKIIFQVFPGAAEFDATVLRHTNSKNWRLSDISRVNLYGNQSHCVDDAMMKKYCYCTDLLE